MNQPNSTQLLLFQYLYRLRYNLLYYEMTLLLVGVWHCQRRDGYGYTMFLLPDLTQTCRS